MRTGIVAVEYSVDAGPRVRVDYNREMRIELTLSSPQTDFGQVIVEFWIYDFAGNVAHQCFWQGIEDKHVISVQPMYDGKFRVYMDKPWHKVEQIDTEIQIVLLFEDHSWTKLPDDITASEVIVWKWTQLPTEIIMLINPKEHRC